MVGLMVLAMDDVMVESMASEMAVVMDESLVSGTGVALVAVMGAKMAVKETLSAEGMVAEKVYC
jgi:hypothetical protein